MNLAVPREAATMEVLVIEDDDLLREILELSLTQAGYRVTVARNGREGLRRFGEGRFRVVVCDVGIPDLDGWDVATAVRLGSPAVGVVLMSGGFDPHDAPTDHPDGWVTLPKPFDVEALVDVIDRIAAPEEASRP